LPPSRLHGSSGIRTGSEIRPDKNDAGNIPSFHRDCHKKCLSVGKHLILKADFNTITLYHLQKQVKAHFRSWERKQRIPSKITWKKHCTIWSMIMFVSVPSSLGLGLLMR
jgi:hypothetical protein